MNKNSCFTLVGLNIKKIIITYSQANYMIICNMYIKSKIVSIEEIISTKDGIIFFNSILIFDYLIYVENNEKIGFF